MATATAAPAPRDLTDPDLQRRVAELRRTDNSTNWYYLAREWLFLAVVLGGTIAFYQYLTAHQWSLAWAVPVTLLAIVCVGAGQHRLATLTHEAAHYMLFRNRRLNELVSEWFCMLPILGTTHSYRVQHLGHHQYPNDPERDPDWAQMTMSGHRFHFPMTRGQFLWHCFFKQLLWPPNLVRYVLARARFLVDRDDGSPYRMKRRTAPVLKLVGLGYHVALVGTVAALIYNRRADLLWLPAVYYAAALSLYLRAPSRWFAHYAIKSDLSVRGQAILRVTFNTLLATTLAALTLWTGQPWWLYYGLLWLVPLGTSFAFFMILRQIVQHGNADEERFTNTRVFIVGPLISMAVFPIGNDYHLPHHLFPMVPHYNLRKLHDLLLPTDPYRYQATVVKGYFVPESSRRHPTVIDVMTTPPT